MNHLFLSIHRKFKYALLGFLMLMPGIKIFAQQVQEKPLYLDYTKPVKQRVDDLLSRMTLQEKLSQMMSRTLTDLPRLGIPGYQWGGEAGHCIIARAHDSATIFQVAIAGFKLGQWRRSG